MVKPRIIIADTEVDVVMKLQSKFAEEFFNKLDLEIITDEAYFDKTFSTPRKADVLIVSDALYTSALQKCNIDHILVLDEQNDGEQTGDLSIEHIFKYQNSIKEFFNEIIGKSGNVFRFTDGTEQETQVILFYSASGGVGKTFISAGVSAALAKNYKRVLYINAERLQQFQHILVNSSPISSNSIYSLLKEPTGNVYADIKHVIRQEIFSYLPPFQAELMALGLSYSVYEKIIRSAKESKEFDYIIVDTDVTYDDDKAKLLNLADKVFILTRQTRSSVLATNRLAASINGINTDKYQFVCNDYLTDEDNAIQSPDVYAKLSGCVYVSHFRHAEKMSPEDLSREHKIQEIAFLIS